MELQETDRFSIAVIGIAGRFPGAPDVRHFWRNLVDGQEGISFFSDEELSTRGVSSDMYRQPQFVKARPVLDHVERFAASFFGFSPREAVLMDPQQRIFLECAWQACEDAGYAPKHIPGNVAVFAACGLSTYLLDNLVANRHINEQDEAFSVMLGTDKDFIATRVSYKLNLHGPSVTIQSGCSSSLTAVAMAVQSLLTMQCDMALAGGISVQVPQRTGYLYQADGIASPDGHCRPFSASAKGTVFGDGVGVVVLKRLDEAIRDKDHIYASIRGIAVNNDGSAKIGYTAPSVAGQTEVICRSQALAALSADQIGYVEAHGTATALGDSAEVTALTKAFRQTTDRLNFCALGSVKSNIGHLDAAAGIAGFIKTVLMIRHRRLVPTLHFDAPNPAIDFKNSPFYVNTESTPWCHPSGSLYAGVSSFGIGGTNVHVVLGQAPSPQPLPYKRKVQILPLSAASADALEQATQNLAKDLKESTARIEEVAYTLQAGREAFQFRRAIVCDGVDAALQALETRDRTGVFENQAMVRKPNLYFLYPGGGCQYPLMGGDLYQKEPVFRDAVDRCLSLLPETTNYNLRAVLYPLSVDESAKAAMANPAMGLPALFVTEFAITQLLMSWGIEPAGMIGHSVGEYTAACVSGVLSLADTLRLVQLRGGLFESLPKGAMIAVFLPEKDIVQLGLEGVSIAAVNGASHSVLSGSVEAIARCVDLLQAQQIDHRPLHIDVAGHSWMVEPIVEKFRQALMETNFSKPKIPFISNLTGTHIRDWEACSPEYWCRHLRETVRFADGINVLHEDASGIFLEMGPGRGLSTLIKGDARFRKRIAVSALPHALDTDSDAVVLHAALAQLWTSGVGPDWKALHRETPNRVSLASYPFVVDGARYWMSPTVETRSGMHKQTSSKVQYFLPSWRRALSVRGSLEAAAKVQWFILGGPARLVRVVEEKLSEVGRQPVVLTQISYRQGDTCQTKRFDPCSVSDHKNLLAPWATQKTRVSILHLWCCDEVAETSLEGDCYLDSAAAVESLVALVQGLVTLGIEADIAVVTRQGAQVSAAERVDKFKSTLQAAVAAVLQDAEALRCRVLDLDSNALSQDNLANSCSALLAECVNDAKENAVAYRGTQRWVRHFEPISLAGVSKGRVEVRPGVYILLGGLGELGLVLAKALAAPSNVLIFASRGAGSGNERTAQASDAASSLRSAVLDEVRATGCEVAEYSVDVADEESMCTLFENVESRFGPVAGVMHLAGVTGVETLKLISDLTTQEYQRQVRAKVEGSMVLEKVLASRKPDFCALFSSTAAFLGGAGMLAYSVANCFLDNVAVQKASSPTRWISINWDGWATLARSCRSDVHTNLDDHLISREDAVAALGAILHHQIVGQVIVAAGDLNERLAAVVVESAATRRLEKASREKMSLFKAYVAPKSELERAVAQIWADVIGLDRVGIHDNFFELGGNSLTGLRVVAKIKSGLGRELQVTALFEAPTVESLARFISISQSRAYKSDASARGQVRRQMRAKPRSLVN
jgi:phthiocerol/phenolphthiocerol synthesis type-I polyketide synthase E